MMEGVFPLFGAFLLFDVSIIPRFRHKGTTISKNGKSTLLSIYYFGGSEICRLPNFSLSKIISL